MRLPVLGWTIDERFRMHRLRSTSIGGICGMLVAAYFFFYHLLAQHIINWELFAVVMTTGLVKIAVVIWYRMHD